MPFSICYLLRLQHAVARDDKGKPIDRDFYNSPLTSSGKSYDDMLLAKFETVYTGSGDQGSSLFVFNVEQGLPVFPEWLFFNRATARARKGVEIGPTRLVLSLSGGHVVGGFPPHEAFAIGGTNSVRGYEEGAVGSGLSYVVGSGEVSFRMFGPVEGTIFADYGSDLGSGPLVPGDPAGARTKPGSGYGYGAGIHVDSPLGPLRAVGRQLSQLCADSVTRRLLMDQLSCPTVGVNERSRFTLYLGRRTKAKGWGRSTIFDARPLRVPSGTTTAPPGQLLLPHACMAGYWLYNPIAAAPAVLGIVWLLTFPI
ncbi:Outer envelope protein 80, chloroplastic [Asimina triloba]